MPSPPNDSIETQQDSVEIIDMLDNAVGSIEEITRETEDQQKIATDTSQPLDERLEAYEDIIDSEVGDTHFSRARNLERIYGFRQIFLKFEGGNPSGTQKDRIAFAQAMDAIRRGYDAITVATCGNYGVAMSVAASLAGLRCLIYIPDNFHTSRVSEMIKLGGEIVRVPGDYENAVIKSRERAKKDEIYDANPGGANTGLQLRAYGEIAYEIYDELRDAPAVVAVPMSNGTTLAGIYKGFLSLYRRGKTSRIPKIVGGSSYNKNPIVQAFLKNKPTCEDLSPERIRETRVNEPLINWHSIDGDYALWAIRETSGWAANASDKQLLALSKLIREQEGLNVLPASTAGMAALLDSHKKTPLHNDRFVVIFTGRRS
ncbi:MAG: pyridoxal-phosphate dependent enzyme [Calditrichaeota bacterium]|nr:pyridoxal-phosphate dependent enzyme [Calditrichota bacterium]